MGAVAAFMLILTVHMPERIPDWKLMLPYENEDQCWADAREFTHIYRLAEHPPAKGIGAECMKTKDIDVPV